MDFECIGIGALVGSVIPQVSIHYYNRRKERRETISQLIVFVSDMEDLGVKYWGALERDKVIEHRMKSISNRLGEKSNIYDDICNKTKTELKNFRKTVFSNDFESNSLFNQNPARVKLIQFAATNFRSLLESI